MWLAAAFVVRVPANAFMPSMPLKMLRFVRIFIANADAWTISTVNCAMAGTAITDMARTSLALNA
ncbi:hypothetical protein GCM10023155_35390 [Bremerella cremea]